MKKQFLALLIATIVLSSIPLVTAVNSKSVSYKMVYVYDDNYARPDGVGRPKPPKDEQELYEFIANGVKWKALPVSYVINPNNNDGLSIGLVTDTLFSSAETWDEAVGSELFNNVYSIDTTASVNLINPYTNNNNELVFGDIPQSGAIAVCIVWYVSRGPPSQRRIVEFDIVFDHIDFTWGDAGPTSEDELGDTSVMDLQNIATHELGHALGLADLYFDEASEQTMYGYGTEGETKKRTLNTGDIEGINKLYG